MLPKILLKLLLIAVVSTEFSHTHHFHGPPHSHGPPHFPGRHHYPAHPHFPGPHPHHHGDFPPRPVYHPSHCPFGNPLQKPEEDLAKGVQELDTKVQSSCKKFSNGKTREVVDSSSYMVKVSLPGYSDGDFQIKIKGRVLYIDTSKKDSPYTEERILPTFVDYATAVYKYVDDTLSIMFSINREATTCNVQSSDIVRNVPLLTFDIMLKNGESF